MNSKHKKHRILIVDDVAINIDILAEALRHVFKIQVAKNGKEAIARAQKNLPDLILMDIEMPEMNGHEACQELKKIPETRDIPIIFVTSKNEPKDRRRAFTEGGVDYIIKPFDIDEVYGRIMVHLKMKNFQRELENKNQTLKEKVAKIESLAEELARSEAAEKFRNLFLQKKQEELKKEITEMKKIFEEGTINIEKITPGGEEFSFRKTFLDKIRGLKKMVEKLSNSNSNNSSSPED